MKSQPLKLISCASLFAALTLTACEKQTPAAGASAPVTPTAQPTQTKNHDGPFGLNMGISIAELTNDLGFTLEPNHQNLYTGTPPKPSNLFEAYSVRANSKTGLCQIMAVTKEIKFNGTGDQIKQEVDAVAAALAVKYGKGKLYDFVTGIYEDKPIFWFMAAKDRSATYAYDWTPEQLAATAPNIERINVESIFYSQSEGVARVAYYFKNSDDCTKEATQKDANNL